MPVSVGPEVESKGRFLFAECSMGRHGLLTIILRKMESILRSFVQALRRYWMSPHCKRSGSNSSLVYIEYPKEV